jgi:hypothetical protein
MKNNKFAGCKKHRHAGLKPDNCGALIIRGRIRFSKWRMLYRRFGDVLEIIKLN